MDILNNKQFRGLDNLEQKMLYYMMFSPPSGLPETKEDPNLIRLGHTIKKLINEKKIILTMDKECKVVVTELTTSI